jgi:hypothetical protein
MVRPLGEPGMSWKWPATMATMSFFTFAGRCASRRETPAGGD